MFIAEFNLPADVNVDNRMRLNQASGIIEPLNTTRAFHNRTASQRVRFDENVLHQTAFRPQHRNFSESLPHSRYRDSGNSDVSLQQGHDLIASLAAQSSRFTPDQPDSDVISEYEQEHVPDCPLHPDNQRSADLTSSPTPVASSPATDDTADVDAYVDEYKRLHHMTGDFIDENYDQGAPAVYIKAKAQAGLCK